MFLGLAFIFIVILFLLFCILTSGKAADQAIAKFDRERIVAHRDKRTLIIPEGEQATDETKILYFATGKGFVNGRKIQ
jgi:Na+-transporting methylmalonyl-CoA/oxaloacetate decarboxylase gamma subunit